VVMQERADTAQVLTAIEEGGLTTEEQAADESSSTRMANP